MTTCKSYLNGRSPVSVGCKYYDDCFTCIFPDCKAPTETAKSHRRRKKGKIVMDENVEPFKRACELHDKGYRNIDIARELGKSDSLIHYWLKKYKEGRTIDPV